MDTKFNTYFEWLLNTRVISALDNKTMPDNVHGRCMVVPRILCNDGESVSVQAGEYLYCSPRENYGGWYKIEAGYPSCVPPDSWRQYAEEWSSPFKERMRRLIRMTLFMARGYFEQGKGKDKYRMYLEGLFRELRRQIAIIVVPVPCNSIYPYMPIEQVKEFIDAHGGENTKACFAQLDADKLKGSEG